MDDAQFQAWLAQHGGEVGRKDNEKDVDGPMDPNTGQATKVTSVDSTTITARDGATITLRRNPGPHVGNATVYTVTARTPPKSADGPKEGEIRGPQTGPTREVFQNGQWVVQPNPVYQPPASQTQPQTVATNTTEPFIVERMPDNTLRTTKNPNYRGPESKPGTNITVKGGDGKTYLIPIDAQGNAGQARDSGVPGEAQSPYSQTVQDKDTGRWWGLKKDGSGWVEIPGGPGAQQTRPVGPAMPTFIVGMASDALRQYADQLNAAVAAGPANGGITAGERDKRYAEAYQLAQTSVNEAATIQRQNESNLNARVNLATTKYANEVDGLNNAFKFVTDLNGRLEEGSTAGATAFAALIGMQAIARRRSGIDAIQPPSPGDQRSPQGQQIGNAAASATATANAQISRLTNPANPQAVLADQQAVRAALEADQQAAAAQAAAANQPAAPVAPVQAASTQPSGLAPIMPSRMAPPAAAPAQSVAPATAPSTVQPRQYQLPEGRVAPPWVNPATGDAAIPALNPPSAGETGGPPLAPGPVYEPATTADPLLPHEPGFVPTPPASYGGGSEAPVQMAPPDQDFAIMRAMSPQQSVSAAPDMTTHPLLLRSEAESLPPWRITPDRITEMEAAGVPPESIWSLPSIGRVA